VVASQHAASGGDKMCGEPIDASEPSPKAAVFGVYCVR
jgi:hypothetical protein